MLTLTPERLAETPTGRKILEEAESAHYAELEARRLALASTIEAAERTQAKERAPLDRKLAEAEKTLEDLRPRWEAATRATRLAHAELRQLDARTQSVINRAQGRLLRELAWPEVREARNEIARLQDETRRYTPNNREKTMLQGGFYRQRCVSSERPSLERRLAYLVSVSRQGGALDQAALLPRREDCREAIAEIMAGIPEIVMEPVG